MNNRFNAIAVAIALLGISTGTAQAANTTIITVIANIVASPCTVSTETLNIDLGDIQASALEAAGSTTPWSPVNSILLTNCPVGTNSIIARFQGTPATNGDSDGYKNEGAAPTISVQLADNESTPKMLSTGKTESLNIVNKAAQVDVKARLYSSGVAAPGAVKATINVEFEYK